MAVSHGGVKLVSQSAPLRGGAQSGVSRVQRSCAAVPIINMSPTALFNSAPNTVSPLTLSGSNGYSIQGDRVILSVSEIANHRNFDSMSGSLSLELWALNRPYAGGEFDGVALAGVQIGCVQGQHRLVNGSYDLPFTAPGAGTWTLTLMLREWEGQGFVTRDHVQFAQPYEVKPPAVAEATVQAPALARNVITMDFGAPQPRDEAVARPVAKAVDKVAAAVTVTKPAAAVVAAPAAAVDRRVSLNEASRAEIAAIKGVSKKLADAIVAARPLISMRELLAVKGMDPRLLNQLRQLVRL